MTTEIKFKRDTQFRNGFFVPESFAHPAKMDAQLLIWITEKFTSPGETILDPMFGSGTTMLACTIGRNVIGVELEQKFVNMAKKNWEKVRQRPQLGYEMGKCQIYQGDARNLNGLLADKIITSPPYTNRMDGGMKDAPGMLYTDELKDSWYTTRDQNNIGNLPYGSIDKVITSPPYENSATGENRDELFERMATDPSSNRFGRKSHPHTAESYTVDSIVTSPPYEAAVKRGDESPCASGDDRPTYQERLSNSKVYSNETNNIGNLKGQTYLDAMLQVYQQCHSVLKADGLMILVTKNFIRNKTEIRLDQDTIRLCEQAGFTFQERYYRKLSGQSFWRTIYQQKYPDAPVLDKEDVLVFVK